jgi:hypothetical protein
MVAHACDDPSYIEGVHGTITVHASPGKNSETLFEK